MEVNGVTELCMRTFEQRGWCSWLCDFSDEARFGSDAKKPRPSSNQFLDAQSAIALLQVARWLLRRGIRFVTGGVGNGTLLHAVRTSTTLSLLFYFTFWILVAFGQHFLWLRHMDGKGAVHENSSDPGRLCDSTRALRLGATAGGSPIARRCACR